MQGFEAGDFVGEQPQTAGERSSLVMNVGAETPDAFAGKTEIDGLVLLQVLILRRAQQREQ
ncbi:hypothetical protein D3C83_140190 [compost metagenome]